MFPLFLRLLETEGLSHSDFVISTASPEFSPGPSNFGIFAAEGLEDPITFNL